MSIRIDSSGNSIIGVDQGVGLIGQPVDEKVLFCIHKSTIDDMSMWSDSKIRRNLRDHWYTRREQDAIISYIHYLQNL